MDSSRDPSRAGRSDSDRDFERDRDQDGDGDGRASTPAGPFTETVYTVIGTVSSPDSPAVGGLVVQLVDKNVGGDVVAVRGQTDAGGTFTLRAGFTDADLRERHKTRPDLQVQALHDNAVAAGSVVRWNASPEERLDVSLPAGLPLPSEYETLTTALAQIIPGSLADLQEGPDRQDITYLANKSGWDARAVAMSSLAAQLGVQGGAATNGASPAGGGAAAATAAAVSAIHPAFYYALLRAGLPSDPVQLHLTQPATVQAVWQQAIAQRVIPQALEQDIPAALQQFQAVAANHLLTAPARVGPSTLGDLLHTTFGNDPARAGQFASLYVQYQDQPEKLWSQVEQAFGADTAARLQLDGALAYLTVNNAPLVAALHNAQRDRPVLTAGDLVDRGYADASAWSALLQDVQPPDGIAGTTVDEKKANYAELLAAHVRVGFPTATVGHMVGTGTLPLGDAGAQHDVATFLSEHQATFDIGVEPVQRYLARTGTVAAPPVVEQVTRLQRVYQITPDHTTMAGLLGAGVDSAYAVVQMGQEGFLRTCADKLGGEAQARMVFARARTVYASTLGVTLDYLSAKRAPALGSGVFGSVIDPLRHWGGLFGNAGPPVHGNGGGPSPVFAQATLDDLFGNLDYCTCDDCQSIISPAAYLVDLLHFVDVAAGAPFDNPQSVLLHRRPDIGALPLTCDNTNIALPYLDLVNETLEYYAGNGLSMAGYAGHDTDGTVSHAALDAAPQNDDDTHAQAAYTTLQQVWFPAPLPFHRELERLRSRLTTLGTTLHDVMKVLRTGETLEAPIPADRNSYGWRDILAERLGISRLEYRLLTDSTLTLAEVYGYAPGTDVVAQMSPLQEFSRRTGVAYTDVEDILRTRFINPSAALIPLLDDLEVTADVLKQVHDGTLTAAQFAALLPAGLDPARYGAVNLDGVAAWVTNNYASIMDLVVIDVAGAPCDTTKMLLRRLNPDPAADILQPVDFVRLLRFIRLWRRLGLSVQHTDDLLSAFYQPTGPGGSTDLQLLDGGMLATLPRIGLVYELVDLLGLDLQSDLDSVLTLWAPIGTAGPDSLYARMFLSPSVLPRPVGQPSPFRPAQDGTVLTPPPGHLLDEKTALCAALNLTSTEFDLITGTGTAAGSPLGLGYDGTTPLALDRISAVYRRAWLARVLRISVLELLSLTVHTGIDPFAPPVADDAHPVSSPALDFIRMVQDMAAAGLSPVQALYLLWNVDLSGVSQPDGSVVTGLAAALRSAFVAIDGQFAVTPTTTLDTARGLMALVLGAPVAATYVGLLDQTNVVSISFGYTQPQLPPAVVSAGHGRLGYDDLAKRLSFTGYLDAATLTAMEVAAAADVALTPALVSLGAAATQSLDTFFARYDNAQLRLRPLYTDYVSSPDPTVLGNLPALLAQLLPLLADRRKQQQALTAVTAAAGSDAGFAPRLLDTGGVIPSATAPASPAVDDFTALAAGGLSVAYFFANDPTLPPDKTLDVVGSLSYGPGSPLRPPEDAGVAPFAATWSGWVLAPQNGDYDIRIAVDAGATVDVRIAGAPVAGAVGAGNVWSNAAAVSFSAGSPTAIRITARGLTSTFAVTWETTGAGWQPIPSPSLLAAALVDHVATSYLRFLKTTGLAADLSLTPAELIDLATAEGLTVGVAGAAWPAALTVNGPAPSLQYADLARVLRAVLDFARLKARFSTSPIKLLDALTAVRTSHDTGRLLALTGWAPASLQALVLRLFGVTDLWLVPDLPASLRRLDAAFAVVTTCRLSAGTLIAAATCDPTDAVVSDFEAAMRSRYAQADWLHAVKPANDTLREMQRDALVAYILVTSGEAILAELGIATGTNRVPTADDLFNYFLMDVEMQPCMETSRIRHALSSVQLFIERSLRNLEPMVDPASIDAQQWEWRKRYRVWQANREVFLWPENWLDPSLRDDQSPMFKTTLKQLLQSDISDDGAASAYLDYLSKLEQVAKLEPCALYYQPATAAGGDDVAHVIARTAGAHRKYHYRRYEGGAWTPWEEVKLQIDDDPVAIYKWNNRLVLLWLQIQQKPAVDASNIGSHLPGRTTGNTLAQQHLGDLTSQVAATAPSQTRMTTSAVLYFSEYYNGQWQPAKTSDVDHPVNLQFVIGDALDRSTLMLRPWHNVDATDEALYVDIANRAWAPWTIAGPVGMGPLLTWGFTTGFVLHNTHSAPVTWGNVPPVQLTMAPRTRGLPPAVTASSAQTLRAEYKSSLTHMADVDVLTGHLPQRAVPAQPLDIDQWDMPFFFGDVRNVFYVTSDASVILIDRYRGYGLWEKAPLGIGDVVQIPPVVGPQRVPPGDPVEKLPIEMGDPVAAQQVIAQGMRAVIADPASLSFQGRDIGATGSVAVQAGRQASAGSNGETPA
ncbi:MAG TPA: neuraminidase-like domain-containing protein [Candidatus Angelobacter sp.]|jgi:hypothetical protein|nr:neuraminidase-like domain-containing protein [Candidatus Angelobacter sp.]